MMSRRVRPSTALAVLAMLASVGLAAPAQADGPSMPANLPSQVRSQLDASERAVLGEAVPTRGERTREVSLLRRVDGRLTIDSVKVAAEDATAVAEVLGAQPGVAAAGVAQRVAAFGDELADEQWALPRLKAPQVRTAVSAAAGSVVAVVDTGVDATHPDLDDVLVGGYDAINKTPGLPLDDEGHGTHVSGIIGAEVGNLIGVEGLLSNVRIMPVKALAADGGGWTADIADGVIWAVDHGADVVNLSLGGPEGDAVLQAAVEYAEGEGVTVVAAMGNEYDVDNAISYPAAYPSVLAVGATDEQDAHASFSNTGPHIDVAAPGVSILSTCVDSSYCSMDGTSMATPYVAAVAAAVHSQGPTLSAAQIRAHIEATADDLGAKGFDDFFGWGLIDPLRALTTAAGSVRASAPQALRVAPGSTTVTASWNAPLFPGSSPVTSYRVTASPTSGAPTTVSVSARTARVSGLKNGTAYRVTVQALTVAGASPVGSSVSVVPRDVTTAPWLSKVSPGNGRVTLTWSAPGAFKGAAPSSYRVALIRSGHANRYVTAGYWSRAITVTGLANGATYGVRVQSHNAAGYSGWSRYLSVKPRTVSGAARSVKSSSGSTRDHHVSVTARWKAPSSSGGAAVTSYVVRVRKAGSSKEVAHRVSSKARSLRISGLKRSSRYSVTVQAQNAAGYSHRSKRSPAATAR